MPKLKPGAVSMEAIAFRLPADLAEKLRSAAAARGRSIADEMRARVEASLAADAAAADDPALAKLQQHIARLANILALDGGWSTDSWAHDAFVAGIAELVNNWKPAPGTEGPDNVLGTSTVDDAGTVGRRQARLQLREDAQ
jgi:plasmid stability protein